MSTIDDIIGKYPGSELFRDLLVAETEEELEALAKDLSGRVEKVRAKQAEAKPKAPTGTIKRADGYVEGSASSVEEAVSRRDMQSYLRLKKAAVEAEMRQDDA